MVVMKRRIFCWIVLLTLLVAVANSHVTLADPADVTLSQEQLTAIKANCISAQSQLQRVLRSDTVARTNRGRAYDITLRLMAALNSRVVLNKINLPKLAENTTALQSKFNQLYNDFTKYNNSMTNTINLKCQNQPAVFYATLTQTRGLRVQLAGDIRDMDRLVDDYAAAVNELKDIVTKNPTTGGNQ